MKTNEEEEIECDHDWRAMSDEGWKRCRKCQTMINYDDNGLIAMTDVIVVNQWWNNLTPKKRGDVMSNLGYVPLNRDFTQLKWEDLPKIVRNGIMKHMKGQK